MSARTDTFKEIDHLPAGSVAIRDGVSWEDYEQLLREADGRSGVRMFYDRGRLAIMTVTRLHEMYSRLLHLIVHALAEKNSLDVESCGSTTLRDRALLQGAEPDECFYLTNAPRIIGKKWIDLSVDPPPDLLIEVDVANESTSKPGFYSSIGVPEVWICDGQGSVRFLSLSDSGYCEVPTSTAFPILSSEVLAELLKLGATHGQGAALHAFRAWLSKALSR